MLDRFGIYKHDWSEHIIDHLRLSLKVQDVCEVGYIGYLISPILFMYLFVSGLH